jgi:hypothetical protein
MPTASWTGFLVRWTIPVARRPVAQRGLGGLGCLQRCLGVGDQVIGSAVLGQVG